MKNTCSLLLVVAMLLTLCACGSSGNKNSANPQPDHMVLGPTNSVKDEDVLLTVELTPENFSDYFECVVLPCLDQDGQPIIFERDDRPDEHNYVMGLKSIHTGNYILIEDGESVFSYELIYNETNEVIKAGDSDLVSGCSFVTGNSDIVFTAPYDITDPSQYTLKLVSCSGTVTFVNAKCLESTEVEDLNHTKWGYQEFSYRYRVQESYWNLTPYTSFNNMVLGDYAY